MGREVSKVIKKRWERRLKKLGPPQELLSEESIADKSANN